jgi:Dpy-30 motif
MVRCVCLSYWEGFEFGTSFVYAPPFKLLLRPIDLAPTTFTHSAFLVLLLCIILGIATLIPSPLGMSELVRERPANPIEFLASYLLAHDPQRIGTSAPAAAPPQQQQQQPMPR